MQVYQIEQFNLDSLKLTERPDPQPGAGEVLVAIKSVSLNYRDHLMLNGQYNPRQPLPLIPLSDGAGEVLEVGHGVEEYKIGDRVVACFLPGWESGPATQQELRNTLGGPLDGTLCEKRVFSQNGLLKIPTALSYQEAATLPCAALTAWSALSLNPPLPGETVLTLGTGGVSIFALQFAQLMGARVIITSSSDAKLERAKEIGASAVINYNQNREWWREVRRLTGKRGVDHVIEVGGSGTLEQSIRSLRPFGTISLIGVLGGGAGSVNLTPVLMQNIRIQGVLVGHRKNFQKMLQAIKQHNIHPLMDSTFAFKDAAKAFQHLAAGKHFGKVCISLE